MKKKLLLPIMFSVLLLGLSVGVQPALAADSREIPLTINKISMVSGNGTTGSLEIGSTSAYDGAIVAVRCYGLEVSADYNLSWAAGDYFEFTTGSSQEEFTVYITVDKPAGSEAVTIQLLGGAVVLDSLTIQVKDDSLIPDAFLIGLGITLLVLFLIVGLVKRMRN